MYLEQQLYHSRRMRWIQGGCAGGALLQLWALAAAETGMPCLPFGYAAHWSIVLLLGLWFGLLSQTGLMLRISAAGLAMRFFPYQYRFERIPWNKIHQIRLLPAGEQLPGARFGRPVRTEDKAYWLTFPQRRVLHVALINGVQFYLSTERPGELLDFLQHGLALHGTSVRVGQL